MIEQEKITERFKKHKFEVKLTRTILEVFEVEAYNSVEACRKAFDGLGVLVWKRKCAYDKEMEVGKRDEKLD